MSPGRGTARETITYPGGETVVVEGLLPGEAGDAVVYDISIVN
jgi:hypothetical protein